MRGACRVGSRAVPEVPVIRNDRRKRIRRGKIHKSNRAARVHAYRTRNKIKLWFLITCMQVPVCPMQWLKVSLSAILPIVPATGQNTSMLSLLRRYNCAAGHCPGERAAVHPIRVIAYYRTVAYLDTTPLSKAGKHARSQDQRPASGRPQ